MIPHPLMRSYAANRGVVLLACAAFFCYWSTHFGVLPSGDSAENIRQIERFDILSRSPHFTFHLLGVVFYAVFGAMAGGSAVVTTELMLIVVGTISVPMLYRLAEALLQDTRSAFTATVIYAFSSGIWRFAVQSEYLVLVPALGIISMYFYQERKPVLSGVFMGLALLVSPFIVFTGPFYLYSFKPGRSWFRLALLTAVSALLVYAGANAFMFQDTISGNWSLGQSLYRFIKLIDLPRGAAVLAYGMVRSFHIMLPFALAGGVMLYRHNRRLFWVVASVILLHIPTTLAEARQGAYMFGSYPFIALLAAVGLLRTLPHLRRVAIILIAAFFAVNLYIVSAERTHFRDTVATYHQLERDPHIVDGAVVFVYPSRKPFDYYTSRLKGASVEGYVGSVFGNGSDPGEVLRQSPAAYLVESGIREPDDAVKRLFARSARRFDARGGNYGQIRLSNMLPGMQLHALPGFRKQVFRIE